jgi:hypothetical protein
VGHRTVIPALRRQREKILSIWGQPGLHGETLAQKQQNKIEIGVWLEGKRSRGIRCPSCASSALQLFCQLIVHTWFKVSQLPPPCGTPAVAEGLSCWHSSPDSRIWLSCLQQPFRTEALTLTCLRSRCSITGATLPAPLDSFKIGSLRLFTWGWLQTAILPISASWVARVIGVSHRLLASTTFFNYYLNFLFFYK